MVHLEPFEMVFLGVIDFLKKNRLVYIDRCSKPCNESIALGAPGNFSGHAEVGNPVKQTY